MSTTTIPNIYAMNGQLLDKNLDGIDAAAAGRALGAGNNISWILGHIIYWRQEILVMLGGTALWDQDAATGYKGVSRDNPVEDVVSWEEKLNVLSSTSEALTERLQGADLSAVELAGPLTGLGVHEAYHVGQIGVGRRVLGLPGVI